MSEFLIIDGRLEPDNEFRLRRTYSTSRPRRRDEPRATDGRPLRVLILDREGNVIGTGHLRRYEPPEPREGPPRWKVTGQVALPRDAVEGVVLDGDTPVGRFSIDETPFVTLSAERAKDDQLVAYLEFTNPSEQAWMAITVFSDGQAARTVYVGQPVTEFEIDLDRVYGTQARLGVMYSTGTRSAAAASEPIVLVRREIPLVITQPAEKARFSQWDVFDVQAGLSVPLPEASQLLSSTRWLVDDEPSGTGRLIAVGPLAPGRHIITAVLDEPDGYDGASASVQITVARPRRRKGYEQSA